MNIESVRAAHAMSNNCNLCWLGPCMCNRVITRERGDIPNCIPVGKDDHVWRKSPMEVATATMNFVKAMREEVNAGIERRVSMDYAPQSELKKIRPWTDEDTRYWLS